MKKFISMLLICLSLSFCIFAQSAYAVNIFDEGVYKAADFNFSSENKYVVQNISDKSSVYIEVFDENQNLLQSIHLLPKSDKYNLIPLKPDYRIVLVGKGNVFIS
ncbi:MULTISPECIES: hypothetical protein [Clostridium]|uniref:Uncharacterized protein n=1 Tax=Clostridium aquiflavi TaxID=3073603 RepID=A0ABU1EDC7_9CLOT|nr:MULTISPECIES: hypothetical protein [unclassified Clostridium]MDR5586371.1 hypothetical protein [Clostridium sp. 5N-1]NFG63380.1 hypothetical protein [Clostridium botulinum]NFQ09140.1 hypothetical protein [Clostridium botulinum]